MRIHNAYTEVDVLAWLDVGRPPAWTADALCQQVDPELWFPESGGSTREAKSICARCDVRADCLAFAMANGDRFGVFGGLSERERRKLRLEAA